MPNLPTILVTGASGFIGRHFLKTVRDDFIIYGLARRSPKAAGVELHPNIRWKPVDVADEKAVEKVFTEILDECGSIDYVVHLAGYYDFTNEENVEYERTNVRGTKIILAQVKRLHIKRFIFASSLTVSEFPEHGKALNEESPTDADFPYARSKRKCEQMVREHSKDFPCTVIRSAAIFSDWCEYAPFFNFLNIWLSSKWNCRILGGKGQSAIPYLHIHDMVSFLNRVIQRDNKLPDYSILIASPDEPTSHIDLYTIAGRYYFGRALPPQFMPKNLSYIGVFLLNFFGSLIGRKPFERLWMLKYVDKKMNIDASKTRMILGWSQTPRYTVRRRLLFLIENMKSNPYEWKRRNEEAAHKRFIERPNLKIFKAMTTLKEEIEENIFNEMTSTEHEVYFSTYQTLEKKKLMNRIDTMYQLLEMSVRLGDRTHILRYAHNLAKERFLEGFYADEVIYAVNCTGKRTVEALLAQDELKSMEQRIHDQVMLTIQLLTDEIEDTFDNLIQEALDEEIVHDS